MKAKIKCIAILSFACHPFAVVTATIKPRGCTFVYLDYELRTEMSRFLNIEANRSDLIRGHRIDVETGAAEYDSHMNRASWTNAEGVWCDVAFAVGAIEALERWREQNPRRSGEIRAPNWRVYTCVRALALAAGLADPLDQADRGEAAA